jgi:hypothetical protein
MPRNLKEVREQIKAAEQAKARDHYQRPKVPEKGNTNTWCGSSWSGEKFSGRNQTGGRDK